MKFKSTVDKNDHTEAMRGILTLNTSELSHLHDLFSLISEKFELKEKNVRLVKIYLKNLFPIECIEQLRNDDIIFGEIEKRISDECRNDFEETKIENFDEWISLNVGGTCFVTTKSTLVAQEPESMLARMFQANWKHKCSSDGSILIDRSPVYFETILNYLRHGKLILECNVSLQGVLEEAKFYAMDSLVETIEKEMQRISGENAKKNAALSREHIIKALMQTKVETYLRFQSVNLKGADLSRLDLSWINFKYANLSGANLSGSNLSYSCFERADLSRANLENAKCVGVRMSCANLDSAVLTNADFEDPSGTNRIAILEGAILKNVNAQACNMRGINLRVATLKNANLANSNLKNANLAACDLENCNLDGCDLTDANLRGANLVGTTFNDVHNALHMSQVGVIPQL